MVLFYRTVRRDFKKFKSKKIYAEPTRQAKSRREWMLDYFQKSCEHLKEEQKYEVWQGGYDAELFKTIGHGFQIQAIHA